MTAATRFGKPLPAGGTIGVAAAASPYDSRSDVLRGIEWWEALGYGVKLAEGREHLAALPLGVACTVDADAKTLTVDEPALR